MYFLNCSLNGCFNLYHFHNHMPAISSYFPRYCNSSVSGPVSLKHVVVNHFIMNRLVSNLSLFFGFVRCGNDFGYDWLGSGADGHVETIDLSFCYQLYSYWYQEGQFTHHNLFENLANVCKKKTMVKPKRIWWHPRGYGYGNRLM